MKQDKKYIILNWKMNFTVSESIEFSNNIIKTLSGFKNKNIEIIICPTYMSLPYCYQILSSFVKLEHKTFRIPMMLMVHLQVKFPQK